MFDYTYNSSHVLDRRIRSFGGRHIHMLRYVSSLRCFFHRFWQVLRRRAVARGMGMFSMDVLISYRIHVWFFFTYIGLFFVKCM